MNKPKRHHWWPQLQSRHWCDDEGFINVVSKDGSVARRTPVNLGVQTHLYSKIELGGARDPSIEKWFAEEVDGPFDQAFSRIFDFTNVRYEPVQDWPEKRAEVKELGYQLGNRIEFLKVTENDREALARFIAGLLVRNPVYLDRILDFYRNQGSIEDDATAKNLTLENMLYVFELYLEVIRDATLGVLRAIGSNEFIFPDSGIIASEPWRTGRIPFDIHAPLTPRISVQVLPVRGERRPADFFVTDSNNTGTARHNRISLGYAAQSVFTRQTPPVQFIKKYFGVPAPKNIGYRFVNGQLETKYDRTRE